MSDLTERLAAKLAQWVEYDGGGPFLYVENAASWLPLLLSEPELVAPLPDEVRLSVLSARERAVMKLGEAAWKLAVAEDEYELSDGFLDSPTPGSPLSNARKDYNFALAEVAALTPEGKE